MKIILTILFVFLSMMSLHEAFAQNNGESQKTHADSSVASLEKAHEIPEYSRSVPVYKSRGKRDPFGTLAPKDEVKGKRIKGLFNYEDASIKGVVQTDDDSYALVVDADEFWHVLREGYRVFGGYVTKITDDGVYLHIIKYGRYLTISLRMEDSKSTVIVEDEKGQSFVQKPGINISYLKSIQSKTKIKIDDVVVPSLKIKTIEELWFGTTDTVPVPGKDDSDTAASEAEVSFTLLEPSDNSWISLPFVMDWTIVSGKNVAYTLIIDDDNDFSSPVFKKSGIRTSSYLLNSQAAFPPNTVLYWKVETIDASGKIVTCRQTDNSFRIKIKKSGVAK